MIRETIGDDIVIYNADCMDVLPSLEDGSVNLIATDPPYFGVKDEEWDNQWETASDYLGWVRGLCREWRRVLAPNGSLYVFASAEMVGRVECIVADSFAVLNRICWVKPEFTTKAEMNSKEDQRSFFPRTEYVLFAEQYGTDEHTDDASGYTSKCCNTKRSIIGEYLRSEFKRAGVSNRQIAALFPSSTGGMTGCVSNWLLGYNMPTAEQYTAMRSFLNRDCGEYLRREYEDLRREYEDLRREYEDLRRPFLVSETVPYTDAWEYRTVNTYPGKHPCEKPLQMMEHIVRASSRPGDTILDCFLGSGVTGQACMRLGRTFIGIEKDPAYYATARRRLTHAAGKSKDQLFGVLE